MSHRLYVLVRMLLGVYLMVHFAQLFPFAAELFSNAGLLTASNSPLTQQVPNLLSWFTSTTAAKAAIGSGVALSVLLVVGKGDRVAALLLWLLWATLLQRMPLLSNPSIPYVGWMLLVHAVLPRRQPQSPFVVDDNTPKWHVPRKVWGLGFALLMVGYSFSGLTKCASPSWADGSALLHVLQSPLARPHALTTWMVEHPVLLTASTYGVLALELLAAPLSLSRRLRPWVWLSFVAMHLGIVVLVDFADLTLGMLLMHALTFDEDWLQMLRRRWGQSSASTAALSPSHAPANAA